MHTEFKVMARLYQIRDTMKRLHRDKFPENIKPYQELIRAAMKKHRIDNEILAAYRLVEQLPEKDKAVGTMFVFSAAVEMILIDR